MPIAHLSRKSKGTRRHSSRRNSTRAHRVPPEVYQEFEQIRRQGPRTALVHLEYVANGATTYAYRYNKRIFKYQPVPPTITNFSTPSRTLRELLSYGLILPEHRIHATDGQNYSVLKHWLVTDDCPCIDVTKYLKDPVYNIQMQVLITQLADTLASHDLYAMDLHIGNIGVHSITGKYYIIDTEGIFRSVRGALKSKQAVNVGGHWVPHVQNKKTWLSIFDPVEGWYATPELGDIVKTYVKHMSTIKRPEDVRLRTFVSHYFLGDALLNRRHLQGGLKWLQVTRVYYHASRETKKIVDALLCRYMGNVYFPLEAAGLMSAETSNSMLVNSSSYSTQLSDLASSINTAYPVKSHASIATYMFSLLGISSAAVGYVKATQKLAEKAKQYLHQQARTFQ